MARAASGSNLALECLQLPTCLLLENSLEHAVVAAGRGQKYNTIPARQHLAMEFSLPENFPSGPMPGAEWRCPFFRTKLTALPFLFVMRIAKRSDRKAS